jgi:hypothetical protein
MNFALNRHEVVTANGCQSESLLLGPMVLNGLTRREQQGLASLYGLRVPNGGALNGPAALACLTVGQVRRHLAASGADTQRPAGLIRAYPGHFAAIRVPRSARWPADAPGRTDSTCALMR